MTTLREDGKKEWKSTEKLADIQAGAIQRIADACEKMAWRYDELIESRDHYKRLFEDESKLNYHLRHRNSGLKSVITRMKKK